MLTPWVVTATDADDNTRVLNPVAEDVIFSDTPEDDAPLLYGRTLDSDLILTGGDFDWLRAIDQAGCSFVTLTLSRDDYSLSGRIPVNQLRFEGDRCEVALSLSEQTPYSCIQDKEDDEINVLQSGLTSYAVKTVVGQYETYSCIGDDSTTCDDPTGAGWVLTFERVFTSPEGEVITRRTWTRETSPVSLGSGWTEENGAFVRAPIIQTTSFVRTDDTEEYNATVVSADFEVDNLVLLRDVVGKFVNECGLPGWRSVFLGKNAPATPDPTVYKAAVYDWAYENIHDLMVAQKSDVKRADSFQNATQANLTWAALFELFNVFNLNWGFQNGDFIVEHASYFTSSVGLDLTASPYAKYLTGLNYYEGKGNDLASKTKFAWMDKTTQDFDGVPIVYDCGDPQNTEALPASLFSTNIAAMLGDNPAIDDLGFALIAAYDLNGDYFMGRAVNPLTGDELLNGALSLPNIQAVLWRDYGNYPTGLINNSPVVFDSVKPQRKTAGDVLIKWDAYKSFDPANLVGCRYGEWRVSKATYSDKTSLLSLELEG